MSISFFQSICRSIVFAWHSSPDVHTLSSTQTKVSEAAKAQLEPKASSVTRCCGMRMLCTSLQARIEKATNELYPRISSFDIHFKDILELYKKYRLRSEHEKAQLILSIINRCASFVCGNIASYVCGNINEIFKHLEIYDPVLRKKIALAMFEKQDGLLGANILNAEEFCQLIEEINLNSVRHRKFIFPDLTFTESQQYRILEKLSQSAPLLFFKTVQEGRFFPKKLMNLYAIAVAGRTKDMEGNKILLFAEYRNSYMPGWNWDFNTLTEKERVSFAKLAAQAGLDTFIFYRERTNLPDSAVIQLYLQLKKENSQAVYKRFRNFEFEDEKFLCDQFVSYIDQIKCDFGINVLPKFRLKNFKVLGEHLPVLVDSMIRGFRLSFQESDYADIHHPCFSEPLQKNYFSTLLYNPDWDKICKTKTSADSYPFIHYYFDKMGAMGDPEFMRLICNFVAVCDVAGVPEEIRMEYRDVIDQIYGMPEALHRPLLANLLQHIAERVHPNKAIADSARELNEQYKKELFQSEGKGSYSLFRLLLLSFKAKKEKNDLAVVMKMLSDSGLRKDGLLQKEIARGIYDLQTVTQEGRWELFVMLVTAAKGNPKTLTKYLNYTSALIMMGTDGMYALSKLKSVDQLENVLLDLVQKKMGIDLKDKLEKYNEYIGNERCQKGFFQLAAYLEAVDDEEIKESLKQMFVEIVNKWMEGEKVYAEFRRSVKNKHTELVFKDSTLADKWFTGDKTTIDIKAAKASDGYTFEQRKKYLEDRLRQEGHYKYGDDTMTKGQSNELLKCLDNPAFVKDVMTKLDGDKLEGQKMWQRRLYILFLKLCETKIKARDIEKELQEITKGLGQNHPFGQYIQDIEELIPFCQSKPAIKAATYILVDTDNPSDIMLAGDEVHGSCLKTNGFNAWCIPSNMSDPKIRMIAVKNAKGEVIARCMFKLLWDKTNKKPVILQEALYQRPGVPKEAIEALNAFAAARAKDLGLDLLSFELGTKPYNGEVCSEGSTTTKEVCDAQRKGVTNGLYSLTQLKYQGYT